MRSARAPGPGWIYSDKRWPGDENSHLAERAERRGCLILPAHDHEGSGAVEPETVQAGNPVTIQTRPTCDNRTARNSDHPGCDGSCWKCRAVTAHPGRAGSTATRRGWRGDVPDCEDHSYAPAGGKVQVELFSAGHKWADLKAKGTPEQMVAKFPEGWTPAHFATAQTFDWPCIAT